MFTKIKIVFLGCTHYSKDLLEFLIRFDYCPEAIFFIPEYFKISYSKTKIKNVNYANLAKVAEANDIPCYEVESKDGKRITDYYEIIVKLNPDVILALGWYYMVPKIIRKLAVHGSWGIHASLLPDYAGGAPLVWSIINGDKKTGVTLFRMASGVDNGDIIAQKSFAIKFKENIADIYKKATEASKTILKSSLDSIEKIKYKPQIKSEINLYAQRKPEDGKIDLKWSALRIYNFIRAQTKPYPGAYAEIEGKRIFFWKAEYTKRKMGKLNIGEIYCINDSFYINLKDGSIKVARVTFDNIEKGFDKIVKRYNLLGKSIA